MGSSLTRKRWPRCGGQCLRTSLSSYFLSLIVLLIQLPDQGSGVDPVLINAASSLPQTMIRPPTGFGQPGSNPNVISIGAVLESQEAIAQFLQVIEEISLEPNINAPGVTLYAVSIPLIHNPVRTAQSVCEKLIKSQVYAIILNDGGASESSSALAVSQTANFYNIPIIGLQNRDSSMSDKHVFANYLRTVPPFSHQVDVWIEMLKELEYKHVVFIHSADYDGRSSFTRFEMLAEEANIHIKAVIEYEAGLTEIAEELAEADQEMQVRVYLLYANEIDAQAIFIEVARLNMTAPGYVWIVSEQALRTTNVPDGVLALKLFNSTNQAGHIRDAVYVIGMAIKEMYYNENITRPPSNCGDLGHGKWDTGEKFFNYLRKQTLSYGRTGRVSFDGKGDRTDADYEIINVVHGRPVMVGQYAFAQSKVRMQLWLNANNIIWPGYQTIKPIGYVIPTHLKVATIEEEPFVFARRPRMDGSCDYDQIPCPRFDPATRREIMSCCEGYCIDFLRSLSIRLNFSYSLYQVIDNKYGDFEHVNGTEFPKMWTGLVGDLVYKRADMVVAPLTINPERSLVIEFSKPFKYQGISILEKVQPRRATFRFFNEPLADSLWILVGLTVHLVAVALYLLDRFSPFGRYKLPNSDVTEEDALNLSSAIWFAWGVLLNSGIGEGTPRSFGGRVLGMVWAGFAMIMVASYTANLAAFLVLDRPETTLTGINDARLRNPASDFTFATVQGSSVEMYFKRQIELANMYRHMADNSVADVEVGIKAVKEGELDAFIWDSARLEYEAAQDCDLATATEQFGRSGYGIGLQKNSFWTEKINQAVLAMHESGFMEELDNKWILQGDDGDDDDCPTRAERAKPATLGLRNMAGVFILVAVGIIGGIALIGIEIFYKKSQVKQQRQLDAARNAAEKWKRLVERRKVYRESVQQLRQAQLKQQQQTYRKGPGGGGGPGASGGASGSGTRFQQPTIPPPHRPQQQQQQQQQGQQDGRTKSRSRGHLPDDGTGGQQHRSHQHMYTQQQLQQAQQLQQQQQHQSGKHHQHYHHQGTMAGQPMVQQQSQQQQQPYQSIMKKTTSTAAPTSQYGQQTIREMISPPEGFGDDSMTPYVMEQESSELKNSEEKQFYADIQRRLQAKAQMYQTMDSYSSAKSRSKSSSYLVPSNQDSYVTGHHHHRGEGPSPILKDQKSLSKSQKTIRMSYPSTEPVSAADESYEMCVASDAELHTLGLQHQSSQHYFSLPKQSQHRYHRPVSTSPPAGTATLMRPPHLIYRRTDSDSNYASNTA